MIELKIPSKELGIDDEGNFIYLKSTVLQLEHSLMSLRKWESKWHIPFLGTEKNEEQLIDYIRCMTINKNVDPLVYENLSLIDVEEIIQYIKNPMSATTFGSLPPIPNTGKKNQRITAEIIYYWMITLGIPIELEKWHLEQLLTLIKVVSIKNQPSSKMDQKSAAKERARLNAERRAKLRSNG